MYKSTNYTPELQILFSYTCHIPASQPLQIENINHMHTRQFLTLDSQFWTTCLLT